MREFDRLYDPLCDLMDLFGVNDSSEGDYLLDPAFGRSRWIHCCVINDDIVTAGMVLVRSPA